MTQPDSIQRWCDSLAIPPGYAEEHGHTIHEEPATLVDVATDLSGRAHRLTPAAAKAWNRMMNAAWSDGVTLTLISAFRSIDYQAGIIQRKLEDGQNIMDILTVNAVPGYSEHHTGRAVDIGTENTPHLEEEFEGTDAFDWLTRHAGEFGFTMSYPRDNPNKIIYEPWHWLWSPA